MIVAAFIIACLALMFAAIDFGLLWWWSEPEPEPEDFCEGQNLSGQ